MLPHCEGIATEALQSAEFCKEILCSSLTFFHPHVWDREGDGAVKTGGRRSCCFARALCVKE